LQKSQVEEERESPEASVFLFLFSSTVPESSVMVLRREELDSPT
jgi:hypothetical protein